MKRLKVRVHDTTADVGSRSCSLVVGNAFVGVLSPDNVDEIIKALLPHSQMAVGQLRVVMPVPALPAETLAAHGAAERRAR